MKKRKFPIYNRYLKIKHGKPITMVLACVMPFSQAMLGSMIQVYIIKDNPIATASVAFFYWSMFAMNGKRVALGKWKAMAAFILFATLGTISGVYIARHILSI